MAWEENSRICLHMQLIAILSRIGVTSNNASRGHRLFEAHANQGSLVWKQQNTTLRLGYIYIIHYPAKVASLDESTIKKNCIFLYCLRFALSFDKLSCISTIKNSSFGFRL